MATRQVDVQKEWEDKINRAKKVRDNWKKTFHVDKIKQYLDGKQMLNGYSEADWITVNKIYAHIKSQLPALYSVDPYFYVKLAKSYSPNPMDITLWETKGKIRQGMLNYLKKELKLKENVRLSIQDAHCSYGVCKMRHAADIKENENAGEPILSDDGSQLLDDEGNPLVEPDSIPVNERYEIARLHPDDFLWDEDAGPLEANWKWLAHRVKESWSVAEKNPRYNKSALRKLANKQHDDSPVGEEEKAREERKKGDVKGKTERGKTKKRGWDKKPETLVSWEIYNLENGTWLVIGENGEIPLMKERGLPNGVEKHPFSILRFTLRDDSPYPHPPLSPMIPLQDEYNTARSDVKKHRKRFNRKYLATGPWEDDSQELSKLESGDDGTIIMGNMGTSIDPIQDAQMDSMRYSEISMLNNDMIEVGGGTSDEARGIAGADSATQAGIMDKRLEMKEGDAMSMVIDFVTTIARKLDQLVQANITRDEAVSVTGPQGEYWELVRESDYEKINGEYEYSTNVGATQPKLPQMERASWQAFLAMLQGFPHLLTQKHLMKRMAEMHHIEDEAMLDELFELGKQIMGGQAPMPGQQGSQPGVGEDRPVSAIGGQAGGGQSMNLPGGGNIPG